MNLPGSSCVINDVNTELVTAYRVVRDQPDDLMRLLAEWEGLLSKEHYLETRAATPADLSDLERAARAIYLTKTSFNGLWRENSSGGFNVPWGKRTDVKLYAESNIRAVSQRLQGTKITNQCVMELLTELIGGYADSTSPWYGTLGEGALVYLDPPYIPLTPTASFSSYFKGGFGRAEQEQLADLIDQVVATGANVMLSNSDAPTTREIYQHLDLIPIKAPRSISAAGGSRTPVGEVLGISYPRDQMRDPVAYPTTTHKNVAARKSQA